MKPPFINLHRLQIEHVYFGEGFSGLVTGIRWLMCLKYRFIVPVTWRQPFRSVPMQETGLDTVELDRTFHNGEIHKFLE